MNLNSELPPYLFVFSFLQHKIFSIEDIGLQLFCSIGTNTKIELQVIFIYFKRLLKPQELGLVEPLALPQNEKHPLQGPS